MTSADKQEKESFFHLTRIIECDILISKGLLKMARHKRAPDYDRNISARNFTECS